MIIWQLSSKAPSRSLSPRFHFAKLSFCSSLEPHTLWSAQTVWEGFLPWDGTLGNTYGCNINETNFLATVQVIVDLGFKQFEDTCTSASSWEVLPGHSSSYNYKRMDPPRECALTSSCAMYTTRASLALQTLVSDRERSIPRPFFTNPRERTCLRSEKYMQP